MNLEQSMVINKNGKRGEQRCPFNEEFPNKHKKRNN